MVSDRQWDQARHRAKVLRLVLAADPQQRLSTDAAARELRLSPRQVRTLLSQFRDRQLVSDLVPLPRRRSQRIHPQVLELIESSLREKYLRKEEPRLQLIVEDIQETCLERGLDPPSRSTVDRWIPRLFTAAQIAKARCNDRNALRSQRYLPGRIRAQRPLDCLQIDHSPADCMVVNADGALIGRPSITTAVDVATRAVVGFAVSFESQSVVSIALCLTHALCPKAPWLAERNLGHLDWPMHGRPRSIHADSGSDFKAMAFSKACEDLGIDLHHRHRGTVHTGGVVERALGAANAELDDLPGRTGRDVAARGEYDAEGRAVLTLERLERILAVYYCTVANLARDEKTLRVPLDSWTEGTRDPEPAAEDPSFIHDHFLPVRQACLSKTGIRAFNTRYVAEEFADLVPERERFGRLVVRYDPRDVSSVLVRHPFTGRDFAAKAVDLYGCGPGPVATWDLALTRKAGAHPRRRSQKVAGRREIAAIVDDANASKRDRRKAARKAAVAAERARGAEGTDAEEPPTSWVSDVPVAEDAERWV